ncbi:hypothetical protein HOE31_00675 [bacterium]|jgi:hypothetical protein|nr:hypothetical protein [bacterium]MBT4121448.1 hypothetical protein [bacterium]MBT4335022.1 hypothetical protein [bacterium]MBT4495642.1 hypothetical protein [bacterium]MBT4764118.1 hypothetical protein [bacterium]
MNNFNSFKDIITSKQDVKPPAYKWQQFALDIIRELDIPNMKKSSVFKICKDMPQQRVQQALTDTKELCDKGEKWKYFFKVINENK